MPEEVHALPAPRASTSVKVVVTGPYGVGKTTLIRTLSEIGVITSDRRAALDEADVAVHMDFGRLTIDDDLQLYLFGAPGRDDYEYMWDMLGDGILGFVTLIDQTRPDSVDETMEIVEHLAHRGDVPHVIAVNRVPPGQADRAVRMVRHQLRLGDGVRVVTVDATDRDSAKDLLIELFEAAGDQETGDREIT